MKTAILTLLVLLLATPLFSQTNTFKLGFTGAYPNYYNYDVTWGIKKQLLITNNNYSLKTGFISLCRE